MTNQTLNLLNTQRVRDIDALATSIFPHLTSPQELRLNEAARNVLFSLLCHLFDTGLKEEKHIIAAISASQDCITCMVEKTALGRRHGMLHLGGLAGENVIRHMRKHVERVYGIELHKSERMHSICVKDTGE